MAINTQSLQTKHVVVVVGRCSLRCILIKVRSKPEWMTQNIEKWVGNMATLETITMSIRVKQVLSIKEHLHLLWDYCLHCILLYITYTYRNKNNEINENSFVLKFYNYCWKKHRSLPVHRRNHWWPLEEWMFSWKKSEICFIDSSMDHVSRHCSVCLDFGGFGVVVFWLRIHLISKNALYHQVILVMCLGIICRQQEFVAL